MENKLRDLKRFQELLRNYRLPASKQRHLQDIPLLLLLAPSGTGRNTLIHELVASDDYHFVVSDTTRQPRFNNGVIEQDGIEYWFKSEDEMLEAIENGDMIEAEIIHGQQVSGMSMRELGRAQATGKVAVTDIDIGGATTMLQLHPKAHVVLLIPPSFEEWQRRLEGRGSMPREELRRRFETALRIYQYALDSKDVFIVLNDDIKRAHKIVDKIVRGDEHRSDENLRAVVNDLLTQTENWLQNN